MTRGAHGKADCGPRTLMEILGPRRAPDPGFRGLTNREAGKSSCELGDIPALVASPVQFIPKT